MPELHPPTLSRSPRLLARLLWRRSCRCDRRPAWHAAERTPVALGLRLLPVSHRGRSRSGYAPSFDQARADFEATWHDYDYLPRCTETDVAEQLPQRDCT